MAEKFDPYHVWLGIPPEEQPPNHYRLLGVRAFESDPDAIDNMADQRLTHLRSLQTGPHARLAQKLLADVAAARLVLLNSQTKPQYDEKLRAKLAAAQSTAARPVAAARPIVVATPLPTARSNGPRPAPASAASELPEVYPDMGTYTPGRRKSAARRKSNAGPLIGAGVALAAVIALAIGYGMSQPDDSNAPNDSNARGTTIAPGHANAQLAAAHDKPPLAHNKPPLAQDKPLAHRAAPIDTARPGDFDKPDDSTGAGVVVQSPVAGALPRRLTRAPHRSIRGPMPRIKGPPFLHWAPIIRLRVRQPP